MTKLIVCTHPEVRVDAMVPVVRWGLSEMGRDRMQSFARSSMLASINEIVSSDETKALEAAAIVGITLGVGIEVRTALGENDRSATGFVPPHEFEVLADAFFGSPDESVRGWETARAAQRRVVDAVDDLLVDRAGDTLIVAHGAVGTLLYCHLTGAPIDRSFDQPHQGCYFVVDRQTGRPLDRWRSIS